MQQQNGYLYPICEFSSQGTAPSAMLQPFYGIQEQQQKDNALQMQMQVQSQSPQPDPGQLSIANVAPKVESTATSNRALYCISPEAMQLEDVEYSPMRNVQGQQQAQPQQVIIMQTAAPMSFGPRPCPVVCPSCGGKNVTKVQYESSFKTHLIAVALLVTICCCCIPYLINSCKTANHHCSQCGAYLGTYNN